MAMCSGQKVAIVEDDEILTFLLGEICKAAGFDVCWHTRNVTDALLMLGEDAPDVLLLDFALDGRRDGMELLAATRGAFPGVETILVTGWDLARLIKRIDYVAPDHILQKPVMPHDLAKILTAIARSTESARLPRAA